MKTNKKHFGNIIVAIIIIIFLFNACDNGNNPINGNDPIIKTYTITFEMNDGSDLKTITVNEGDIIDNSIIPIPIVGIVENWYSNQELTFQFNFETPITADINLYANWFPPFFTAVIDTELEDISINGIAFGNGKYVVVGSSGTWGSNNPRIAYSDDGILWTSVIDTTFPIVSYINNIIFSNNMFLAFGAGFNFGVDDNNGYGAYSYDGITWTAITDTVISKIQVTSIAYGNGKFVVGGYYNRMAYSSDGITWTSITDPVIPDNNPSGSIIVAYGNDKFIANRQSGAAWYSNDGIIWSDITDTNFRGRSIYNITYGNDKFVAIGYYFTAYSYDGLSWTTVNAFPIMPRRFGIAYGNGKFIVTGTKEVNSGSSVAYSIDGIVWHSIADNGDVSGSVIFNNNRFFAIIGVSGIAYSSGL